MQRHFSQEEMREILARAEEIHLEAPSNRGSAIEMEAIVSAAEEAGLSRDAVLQAMRERVGPTTPPPEVAARIFAPSTDGKLYVADVLEVGETTVRVRFIRGGELTVPIRDTQPCTLLPGQRVSCPWPDWGWWTCTVLSYDADAGEIKASDGFGTTAPFQVSDVRLNPTRSQQARKPLPRVRFFLVSLAAGAVLGGTLGAMLTWWLTR